VIEATGLRTLKNVVRLIDPATLGQAFDNNSFDEKRRPRLAFPAILKRIVAPAARAGEREREREREREASSDPKPRAASEAIRFRLGEGCP
jgi:hypothetical protein